MNRYVLNLDFVLSLCYSMGYGIYEIVFLNCVIGVLPNSLVDYRIDSPYDVFFLLKTHENLFL